MRAVQFIRAHGYQNLFERRWYTQLDIGEHTYWTMGAPVEETILINRKRLCVPRADTAARPDGPDGSDAPDDPA